MRHRKLFALPSVAMLLGCALLVLAPAASAASHGGVVYTLSNDPVHNSVLALGYSSSGAITPVQIAEYPTGGGGSRFVMGNSMSLFDADRQVIINPTHTLLFAVNSATNTIAVFRILRPGVLRAVGGSPFASFGPTPVSLALSGKYLVVANKALSGDRPITAPPDYTVFRVARNGQLSHIAASTIVTQPGSSPTDVAPSPNGKFLFGTEMGFTGGLKLRSFVLGANGVLHDAPGSPQAPDPRGYAGGNPPSHLPPFTFPVPLGTAVHPKGPFVYFDYPNASRIATYAYDPAGGLHYVSSVDSGPGTGTPCWNLITPNGHYMYVTDSETSNISVFDVSNPASPRLVQVTAVRNGGPPADMAFDPSTHFLFTVAAAADGDNPTGQPMTNGNQLHVFRILPGGTLAELGSSPAYLPIPSDGHVVGLATQSR